MMKKLLVILAIVALASVSTTALGQWKMCIDPGHGGSDAGAVGYVTEKVVNLDTSLKMKDWMDLDTSDSGGGTSWAIYMTRSTDVYVSLSGRTSYANNNNVNRFLSIHANAFNGSAHGSETFCYYSGSSYSFDMRNKIQDELISHGGLYNRGNKTAGFYVIKYTNMPAALTELGFVDNYGDSQSLGSSSWRNNVAKGFLHGMQRHMGYSAYTPNTHVTKIVDDAHSGFSASSSWWTSTWASDKYGSSYKARSTEYTSDAATWTVNITDAGTYDVYAWWAAWSNRASSAPYIVYHSGGSSTIYADQTQNGGQWMGLGSYYLNTGNNSVLLSCWTSSGDYVIADAIKWYK